MGKRSGWVTHVGHVLQANNINLMTCTTPHSLLYRQKGVTNNTPLSSTDCSLFAPATIFSSVNHIRCQASDPRYQCSPHLGLDHLFPASMAISRASSILVLLLSIHCDHLEEMPAGTFCATLRTSSVADWHHAPQPMHSKSSQQNRKIRTGKKEWY